MISMMASSSTEGQSRQRSRSRPTHTNRGSFRRRGHPRVLSTGGAGHFVLDMSLWAFLVSGIGWWSAGCGSQPQDSGTGGFAAALTGGVGAMGPTGGVGAVGPTGGVGPLGGGGVGTGGAVSCPQPVPGARVHPGNFESRGCNTENCHVGFSGGWLYTGPSGGNWVSDATVTIQNADQTVVTGYSAPDGFFSLIGNTAELGRINGPYVPCVGKCPSATVCGTAAIHVDVDCQTSNCHGAPNVRVYLPPPSSGTGGMGGGSSSGGTGNADCIPETPGGPPAHTAAIYDFQACQICHNDLYTGGFVYDGLASTTVVTGATVTLKYADGTTRSALSGPGGMFYYDGLVAANYTACVSRCPNTSCSLPATHNTADDCRVCHNEALRIYVP